MATIQATASSILRKAGWRMDSKLSHGRQCWAKPGESQRVYLGTHGSIRIGKNLGDSRPIGMAYLHMLAQDSTVPQKYEVGKFHYSDYWKSWSYIIAVDGNNVTEVTIIPINACYPSSWNTVGKIRSHCTSLDRKDKITDSLSQVARHMLYDNLGAFEADELLDDIKLLVG